MSNDSSNLEASRPTPPVFLIGARGSGKTSVARVLAEQLGCEWVDSDDEIERRVGKSIGAIFAEEGEARFRDLEAEVVAQLCRHPPAVIALGGGAILRESSRDAVRKAGRVIWLKADVDTLATRITADPATAERRPNLTNAGGRTEIEALLLERTPIYQACATLEVDTEGKSPAEIAGEILAFLATAPK